MTHIGCGGKLTVKESMQNQLKGSVMVKRIRKCMSCGAEIVSSEIIDEAEVRPGYKHGSHAKKAAAISGAAFAAGYEEGILSRK